MNAKLQLQYEKHIQECPSSKYDFFKYCVKKGVCPHHPDVSTWSRVVFFNIKFRHIGCYNCDLGDEEEEEEEGAAPPSPGHVDACPFCDATFIKKKNGNSSKYFSNHIANKHADEVE
mmetsp:Transcript_37951/g.77875  ORF Transcript_37951/g.77875 Transcript_37951/m.77875 type:complete len:117 (-) Transcript_37951:164-514(-)|eukprot:CAMPEP_0181289444 /NCGR_PEP_ID=MMETSP1101-20121128/884_1 /TAXON_ID=46948 /ORGANISM="Rhodomonas abbreviata, Strain Caron Lab Isolate" /LENGTH=116 /DNA_ID=CAMNT_0023393663 /DNA_START=125 /DNA_END=475 /DNA_ORIENTATION=+